MKSILDSHRINHKDTKSFYSLVALCFVVEKGKECQSELIW